MSCWRKSRGELFRLDSKAMGNLVVLGGWSLEFGEDPLQACWFSLQLTQEDVPHLFEREPKRAVATLELFAALVGLMVLVPRENRSGASWGSVDNQGNTRLLQKLATTKFPLCLAMETSGRKRPRGRAYESGLQRLQVQAEGPCSLVGTFLLGSQSIRVQSRGRGQPR